MKHTCHLPGCAAGCPPRWLFCRGHWAMVPPSIQREVYRTVKLRGPSVDASWAPWWRAQAQATDVVLTKLGAPEPWLLEKAEAFASKLESR